MPEFCATRTLKEWFAHPDFRRRQWEGDDQASTLRQFWHMPRREAGVCVVEEVGEPEPIAERFRRLAADWSEHTGHVSSVNDLISHPSYQEIIRLGWDVVPLLLMDLQNNRRFWFPALYAITNVRPFDPRDAGNGRRMTDAWIKWGQKKRLI